MNRLVWPVTSVVFVAYNPQHYEKDEKQSESTDANNEAEATDRRKEKDYRCDSSDDLKELLD